MMASIKTLEQTLKANEFAITAEIPAPISASASEMEEKIDLLTGHVHAINVTDNPGATAHMSSLAGCSIVRNKGIDPIFQVTCRDRNRLAIQSDLMGASALGINNVLTLAGDPVKNGDQPDAKAVFDVNSKKILSIMQSMNDLGETMSGRELQTKSNFFPGGAAIIHEPENNWDPVALKDKVTQGAKFIQTQFCYDVDLLRDYMKHIVDAGLSEKLFFIVGIGPLRSDKSAKWMRDKLFGTVIPDNIVQRMERSENQIEEGTAICAELINQFEEIDGVHGAHLMAPRNLSAIAPTVKKAGIKI
ncbi:MAG: methylenetetrahydrofolate reductase [Gammaproteobacteria bacterium]|nr:methylenetetrahydrofolate reductase [Gammaproteobacteria bacterium]